MERLGNLERSKPSSLSLSRALRRPEGGTIDLSFAEVSQAQARVLQG